MDNKKTVTSSKKGDIHFGANSLDGFGAIAIGSLQENLSNLKGRRLWRCNVCNDLHAGDAALKICPTCGTEDAYVEIDEKEFRNVLGALNE